MACEPYEVKTETVTKISMLVWLHIDSIFFFELNINYIYATPAYLKSAV